MKDLLKHFARKGDSDADVLRRLKKATEGDLKGTSKEVQSQWASYLKMAKTVTARLNWDWKFQNQWATLVSRSRAYPKGMLGFEKVLHLDNFPSHIYDASPGEVTLMESEDGFFWETLPVNSRRVVVPLCLPSMEQLPSLLLSLALSRSQVFDAVSLKPHHPFHHALIPKHTPQEFRNLLPSAKEGDYSDNYIFLFAEDTPFTGLICSPATYRYKAPPTHDHFGIHLRSVPYVLTF